MFKYLILFVLLVGCGGPQTLTEVSADKMLTEFMADCKNTHGERCNAPVVVHSLSESADEQTCWNEDGSSIRHVVLHKEAVAENNKTVVYEVLFNCGLNLGTLENNLLNSEHFILALGLKNK